MAAEAVERIEREFAELQPHRASSRSIGGTASSDLPRCQTLFRAQSRSLPSAVLRRAIASRYVARQG